MAKKKKSNKKPVIRTLNVRPNATLREIYAQARKEFTAADLQVFTEVYDDDVPMEELLADMERINQRESRKRKKKFNAHREPCSIRGSWPYFSGCRRAFGGI